MADAITPRLNLVKPEVGGSADTWGDKWNENADKIDAAIIKPDEENVWSAPQHFDGGLYAGTTSPTDTTEGRVLTVGDFGVGSTAVPAWPLATLNASATTPVGTGYYRISGIPDAPFNGVVLHVNRAGGDIQQVVFSHTNNTIYFRGYYNNNWRPWSVITPIGVGQTWQDVTGSRSPNTTYTNTTGRPIFVAAGDISGKGISSVWLYVDDQMISRIEGGSNEIGGSVTVSGLVPPGSTYRVRRPAPAKSLDWWMELR